MFLPVFLSCLFLNFLAACVPTAQGNQIQADLQRLRREIANLQRTQSDLDIQFQSRFGSISEIEQAYANMQRMSTEEDLQKEQLMTEIQTLKSQVESLEQALAAQRQNASPAEAKEPSKTSAPAQATAIQFPESAKEHYLYAKKLYDEDNFAASIEAFDAFLKTHSNDKDKLDGAYFWKGDAYLQQALRSTELNEKTKLLKKAVLSFQGVLTEFPKSTKVDQCLYKVGICMENLGFKADARAFFEELVKKYPQSTLAAKAKSHLKDLANP